VAAAMVDFWDEYAPWYKLWLGHTDYHRGIKEILAQRARPGWRVLDIGGGSGVLALPLIESGCDVVVVEPSMAMRGYLDEAVAKAGLERPAVIPSRWEEVAPRDASGFDLVVACNSLHLTTIGAAPALGRVFEARPANVFIASESDVVPSVENGRDGLYAVADRGSYRTENSFFYHSREEALRHLRLKERHGQPHPPEDDYLGGLVYEAGHFVHRRWTRVRWTWLSRA
jgi:SAM-dependent methyltransferase